ncbi:phosphoenolpyruvate carboxykinase (ATP) [Gandjariella thermophila]|uniref:phosphoenolpyruvate carboxykinase (ATP) n=1 Tax=Gandjariella thermophila TaxID=1931992 RepID=A0A4D4JET4_9PSEU|nr:phosphoenolpyruvate carboxykinase (ATP) [Gandjariella thermophila]GDY32876.1 phosphoenolpyruvate carboxykinase [ATP] [Gandjariella thermophila]
MAIELPPARSITANPDQEELKRYVAEMPNARLTEFGNYNVTTRVTARSAGSTFIVTDDPSWTEKQTMPRARYEEIAQAQAEYVAGADMILLEGYIGPENSPLRRPARVYIERSNANIPGMQAQLYYPKDAEWREEDALTVVYTPNCPAPGDFPDDRLVTIDLDNWVTRVFNIDYFGESKMGGLRMWMEWAYQQGALAMHAGAKVIPTEHGDKTALIVGLSGTGKTTTTFTRQNNSLPVQDDIVALVSGGDTYATENGCFAKTYGLDPKHEPTIHGALAKPSAWLENVAVGPDGRVDYFDDSYTANGRGTFSLAEIPHFDPRKLGKADVLLILNRNESIVPAVAKMASVDQAVAYYMLGETKGTSAGGKAEAGKFLRVPGTNPFFMGREYQQGNRLGEIVESMNYDFQVYVLNTGRVGGSADVAGSKDVTIPHTSAIVRAIAENAIEWEQDPDFGYLVATSVPDFDDEELLRPRLLYQRQGREDEYRDAVAALKEARREYMRQHTGLADGVIAALG